MTMYRTKVFTENVVKITDRARQTDVSLSTSAAQSAALPEGIYHITSTVDCFIKVSTTANDVTTTTGYYLIAYNTVPFSIPDQNKVGGITASGTGTLYIHKVH